MAGLEHAPKAASKEGGNERFKARQLFQRSLMLRAASHLTDHADIAEYWFDKGYSERFAELADKTLEEGGIDPTDASDEALDAALKKMDAMAGDTTVH